MRNRMNVVMRGIALAAAVVFALIACDDGMEDLIDDGLEEELVSNPAELLGGASLNENLLYTYKYDIELPAQDSYLSRILGWQWGMPSDPGYDFKWCFFNDGTIPIVHCCGYMEKNDSYRYLLVGNVLLTTFSGNNIKVDYITMADDDSFFKWNGATYPKRDPVPPYFDPLASPPLRVTNANNLLGTWQGKDGQENAVEFTFTDDSELRIGSDLYGYLLVSKNEFLTIGPIADGETAGLDKFRFSRSGAGTATKLLLKRPSDSGHFTLYLAPVAN